MEAAEERGGGGVAINPRGVLPEIAPINPSPRIAHAAVPIGWVGRPVGRPAGVFRVNIMETDAKVFRIQSSACTSKESFYLPGCGINHIHVADSDRAGRRWDRYCASRVDSSRGSPGAISPSSPPSLTTLSSTVVDPPRYYARLIRTRDARETSPKLDKEEPILSLPPSLSLSWKSVLSL